MSNQYKKIKEDALKNGSYKEAYIWFKKEYSNQKNDKCFLCDFALITDHFAQTQNIILNLFLHSKAYFLNKKALSKDKTYLPALVGIGRIFWHLGLNKKARKYYLQAYALNQTNTSVLTSLGNIHKQIHEYQKAEDFYLQSAKLNPENYGVYLNLSRLLLLTKHPKRAQKYFDQAQEILKNKELSNFEKEIIFDIQKEIKNASESSIGST